MVHPVHPKTLTFRVHDQGLLLLLLFSLFFLALGFGVGLHRCQRNGASKKKVMKSKLMLTNTTADVIEQWSATPLSPHLITLGRR